MKILRIKCTTRRNEEISRATVQSFHIASKASGEQTNSSSCIDTIEAWIIVIYLSLVVWHLGNSRPQPVAIDIRRENHYRWLHSPIQRIACNKVLSRRTSILIQKWRKLTDDSKKQKKIRAEIARKLRWKTRAVDSAGHSSFHSQTMLWYIERYNFYLFAFSQEYFNAVHGIQRTVEFHYCEYYNKLNRMTSEHELHQLRNATDNKQKKRLNK